jgi:hypothetical protein
MQRNCCCCTMSSCCFVGDSRAFGKLRHGNDRQQTAPVLLWLCRQTLQHVHTSLIMLQAVSHVGLVAGHGVRLAHSCSCCTLQQLL